MSNYVHRSYRIQQRKQYAFEALCHIRGVVPTVCLVDLIDTYITKQCESDPKLGETVNEIVSRRVSDTTALTISGGTSVTE